MRITKEEVRDALAEARRVSSKAEAEGRSMTKAERALVDDALNKSEALKTRERVYSLGAIASDGDTGVTGWGKAAKALANGENRVEGKLGDYLRKAATATAIATESDIQRPGIRPLAEDLRNVYSIFEQADPGTALHVDEFVVTSRDKSGAAVERDPMSTSAKSETDITIGLEVSDLRQFATLISNIPNALFDSEPQLNALLASAMQRELDQALDAHFLTKMDAAATLVSGGSGTVGRVRRAISDIRAKGGNPDTIVIPEVDLEALDVLTEANSFPGWPFGCEVITHPGIGGTGNGFVFDSRGAVLYKGDLRLDRDSLTKLDTNQSRLRLEYNALGVVRFPGYFVKLDESIVT